MLNYFLKACCALIILPCFAFADTTTYDYASSLALGTSFYAYAGTISSRPPTNNTAPSTPFVRYFSYYPTYSYEGIESSDFQYAYNYTQIRNNYASQRYVIEISDNKNSVSEIDINWDGYGYLLKNRRATYGSTLYIWNYEQGKYENKGMKITNNVSDYISDDKAITLLAMANGKSNGNNKTSYIVTDYISVDITKTSFEISAVNSYCSSLQEVTIEFDDDVDEDSAQVVNNYQLTAPSGAVLSINSATKTSAKTVTLALSNKLNDLTKYSASVRNVKNTSGATINEDSSSTFSLACNLNCITDPFKGPGELNSSSWSVSHSSGRFGSPRIVDNGRLRLTDKSGNVATVATLLNQFPGAENKIEIEFDYYGYAGSGADGIAVTFSDAAITPAAGASGGSLGYAQKRGINGFAGGWLGIGIDEYGNFSNGTEGRYGGSGFKRDSITLRGSGSGTSGYPYLKSTGSLSPGVDSRGNTPNPKHRYRISIDHTMGGSEAYISVHRNTGSGFVEIIPRFDIYAVNPSQTAVPSNWVVSFTGSTGGSTNIHEIGDFEVCAALPIEHFDFLDHYEISHESSALTCAPTAVTIKACTQSDCSNPDNFSKEETILDFNVSSGTPPTTIRKPLKFTGSTSFNVSHTTAEKLTLSLSNENVSAIAEPSLVCKDGNRNTACIIDFSDTGFRFFSDGTANEIPTQLSGKPSNQGYNASNLYLQAIKKDTETGVCEAILVKDSKIEIAAQCTSPETCVTGQKVKINSSDISPLDSTEELSYSEVPMDFTVNSDHSSTFIFSYPDAGKMQLHARYKIPESADKYISGSSNQFVVRPLGFYIDIAGNAAAENANGSVFKKAGEDFTTKISAMQWQAADDSNNDGIADNNAALSGNTETRNFTNQSVLINHALVSPSGGNNPNLSDNSFYFSGGTSTKSLNWPEVGVISFAASHPYLDSDNVTGSVPFIGRFTPDHFTLSSESVGYDSGQMSYMGQPNLKLSYTLTAKNASGVKTENYDSDAGYAKESVVIQAENNNDGNSLSSRLSGNSHKWVAGEYVASGDLWTFNRLTALDGPYDNLLLAIGVNGSDGVPLEALDTDVSNAGNCVSSGSCNAKKLESTGSIVRFGRGIIENSYGSEAAALRIPMQTQYWDGADFISNDKDSFTSVNAGLASIIDNNISPVVLDPSISGSGSFIKGESKLLTISPPGVGKRGSVKLEYDFPAWLQYDWTISDGSFDDDPSAQATFGLYRGNDRIIYRQEVFQ